VEGVRSDVYFLEKTPKGKPFAVEVIVEHDLEPESEIRYSSAQIPVFLTYPTWETIRAYVQGVDAKQALNLNIERCPSCRQRRAEASRREQWETEFRNKIDKLKPKEHSRFVLWEQDKFGRRLYPRTINQIRDYAEHLLELGFTQTRSKPYLFVWRIPYGTMFANFGSTDEVPIWEYPEPLLH
jgi:hypothetical protein